MISGLLSDKQLWHHQVSHLSHIATIQVVSPSQNTQEKMVQTILEKAPPKFALAGHSMGGWLALEVMKVAPSRVTKLCLLNTTALPDPEEKRNDRQEMILKTEQGKFGEVVQDLASKLVFNSVAKDSVEKMFMCVGEEVFINQQESMLQRNECLSILPSIPCPTLVIHAAKDQLFSLEEHYRWVDQIQGAKLAIIEDSGHMSPVEMPQAVTALMRFWLAYF